MDGSTGSGEHHHCADPLTEFDVGDADHAGVDHRRMGAEDLFDLDRPELLAPPVDGVGEPTRKEEVALAVLPPGVAGAEPFGRRVLVGPHHELAYFSATHLFVRLGVDHPDRHTGEGPPDRVEPVTAPMVGGTERRIGAECLGLPEGVGELDVRERHDRPADEIDRAGRGSVAERDERAQIGGVETRDGRGCAGASSGRRRSG